MTPLITPDCCACGIKFYDTRVSTWVLTDIQKLKGVLVPTDYPFNKGLLCGVCVEKSKILRHPEK